MYDEFFMGESNYYSYILKSLKDNGYYYGSTSDLDNRLKNHNRGKVRSTKGRRPFVLHFYESHNDKSSAMLRERFYKSIDGYKWLKNSGII